LLAGEMLYNAARALTRISLVLLCRRIICVFRTRTICFWLLVLIPTWCSITFILDALACTPMRILHPDLAYKCVPSFQIWTLIAAAGIVIDFAVILVPLPSLWALKISRKRRIALVFVFVFGFGITTIVAIARIFMVKGASFSIDISWGYSAFAYLSVIEVNMGIICACVILLRPLL
ncbi:hypothetical protein M406DRAFT_233108, partial [Cryphonectria parasitica EP155]